MKKIFTNLIVPFLFVLCCVLNTQAQVIEKVAYTPAGLGGNYDTLSTKQTTTITQNLNARQINAMGEKLGLVVKEIKSNIVSGRDMYVPSQSEITEINIGSNGLFYNAVSATTINKKILGDIISGGDEVDLNKATVTIDDKGQMFLDGVEMRSPDCSLEWTDVWAYTPGGTTAKRFKIAQAESSCKYQSKCPDSKPYRCNNNGSCQECPCGQYLHNGVCIGWKASFSEVPAIASCSAGWGGVGSFNMSGNNLQAVWNANGCNFIEGSNDAFLTSSSFSCDSASIKLCEGSYVYRDEYSGLTTSADMANPNRVNVKVSLANPPEVFYNGQNIPAAEVLDTTTNPNNSGEYIAYPIDQMSREVFTNTGAAAKKKRFVDNTRTLYCGFSTSSSSYTATDDNQSYPIVSYAQNAIYAMKHNPNCSSSSTNMNIPSCYALSWANLANYNSKWLKYSPTQFCEALYSVDPYDSLGTDFKCVVNAPEPTTYQAYRTTSYSISQEQRDVCTGGVYNVRGVNYCINPTQQNLRVATTSADWVDVDEQGYSKATLDDIASFTTDTFKTKLLTNSTTTKYLNQKFKAKVLHCKQF